MKSEYWIEQRLGQRNYAPDFAPNCWINQKALLCFPILCILGGSVLYDGDRKYCFERYTIAEPHKSVTYRLCFLKVLSVLPSHWMAFVFLCVYAVLQLLTAAVKDNGLSKESSSVWHWSSELVWNLKDDLNVVKWPILSRAC